MGNALNILLWDWTSYFLDFSACVLYSMQDALQVSSGTSASLVLCFCIPWDIVPDCPSLGSSILNSFGSHAATCFCLSLLTCDLRTSNSIGISFY
ncbi:hypothetical protein QN277_017577 [Acacia crassicarpa]|uniref:Uncharacterized protein n=1 Tax=Acacia crassicarpa TaxID=499986 RepID=A0AAE1MU66_9FABA|nr:hypothetical protein QN277_017577 [Acacia crassicarpa]